MDAPGVPFSDHKLACRLESADAALSAACARAHARLRPDRGTAVISIAGGFALYAGPDSPLTQVTGVGVGVRVTSRELDQIESFYQTRKTPVQMELCPLADRSLIDLLAARGYRVTEYSNVLYRAVDRAESFDGEGAESAKGLRVVAVSLVHVRDWAGLVIRGFTENEEAPMEFVEAAEATCYVTGVTSFRVTLGGADAGAGSVAVNKGLAVLFGQSTLPAARGRGVQSALLRASLDVAVKAECDLAMMCTLPGTTSQRNAERLGFRVAYTRCKLVRDWM